MVAFEQLHGPAEREVTADLVGESRPGSRLDRPRARGEPCQARQTDGKNEKTEARAKHPRWNDETGQAVPPFADGRRDDGLGQSRAGTESRVEGPGAFGGAEPGGTRTPHGVTRATTYAPRRHDQLERRHRHRAEERRGDDPVTHRRGAVRAERPPRPGRRGRRARPSGCCRKETSFGFSLLAVSWLSPPARLSARALLRMTRAPSPPRSAPTTFSTEPSKNVSTRCRRADLRAARRGTAGR